MSRQDPPEPETHGEPEAPPRVDGVRELGPYKLLALLGEGGMGVVYLAEQTAPVRRRVAIKVLKPGMDTAQVVARFDSERQALAVMDHPNIAKVLDSGVTPQGRPYFVMELVHGTSIADYADTHRLTTAERLLLFIDVCHAVQHAHQKGVIHRDLKPSNVLVTVGEAGPVVKVIDFGIAKAVGLGLTERTLVTRAGQMIGTPEYMSPEQADLTGLDVDTRTDVYSLGVMLYELLVGALPFELSTKPGYLITHTLREIDVPRPSTRLTALGDTLEKVARHRRTTPESLRRELRGDLDWVILKAMEKDRTRRYETPNALARELERYLGSEPVFARPPSTGYRLRKFARRNRGAVAAASVAFIGIVAGGIAATVGLVQARQAQQRAERAAASAEQMADFLVELFSMSDPVEFGGIERRAREVLDRGAARVRSDLAGQPAIQARLLRTIGDVYRQLGLYDAARPMFEHAVEVWERAPDRDHRELALALHRLGSLHGQQGRADEAERTMHRAIELYAAAGSGDSAEIADMWATLASVYLAVGRFTDADPLFRRARGALERAPTPNDDLLARIETNLGVLHLRQREPTQAAPHLERALAIHERTVGLAHPRTGHIFINLGAARYMERDLEAAEANYVRAQQILEAALGSEHPWMAAVRHNLGEIALAHGRHGEAEAHLRDALAIKERTWGRSSTTVAQTLKVLGNVHRERSRFADAETHYRQALRIFEETVDPGDPLLAETLREYAAMLRLAGRADEADRLERRAADLGEREDG